MIPVVECRRLSKTYKQGPDAIEALRGVSLTIHPGEFVAITGPSGSGKSTLLHLVGGLDTPDSGIVLLEGVDLGSLDDGALALVRRRRLGLVLQFFNLLPTLSAVENVAFPLLLDGAGDAMDRAHASLAQVGLDDRAAHRPSELSGGEQQRVALARALVTKPALLLADEPTGNLDSATGLEILRLLVGAAGAGQTIVMVTHDATNASRADRILPLIDGALVTNTQPSSDA